LIVELGLYMLCVDALVSFLRRAQAQASA